MLSPFRVEQLIIVRRADQKIEAAFPPVLGTDPWKRHEDAKDFCRQNNWRFLTYKVKP